jgi:hypothetical protein
MLFLLVFMETVNIKSKFSQHMIYSPGLWVGNGHGNEQVIFFSV